MRRALSRTSLMVLLPGVMSLPCQAGNASRGAITIVLANGAAAPVKFAAQELVKYLTAMGSAKPKVVQTSEEGDIYLGVFPGVLTREARRAVESNLKGTAPDSFVIRSFGKHLVIYGNSPRAILYGAYHYLETLGVRWYFPGHDNEVVPHRALKLEGYDIRQVPSFRKRGIIIFSMTPGFEDIVDFAAKAKLNTIGLHAIPYGPQTRDVGLDYANKVAAPRGLAVEIERHLFGSSYCPDDAVGLQREKTALLDYVRPLPASMDEFFLWPADKVLARCMSPQYRHYTVSDLVMWFANQMLVTLQQSRPRARFAFLSYLSTWEPPMYERPLPGLVFEWAPMFQSFAYSLDDPRSRTNAEYRGDFEAFLKMFGGENTQVLSYWLDDTLFSRTSYGHLPYNPGALQRDLSYYHRMGVNAVTTFGVMTGRDYFLSHASPAVFLYPRLLWNVQTDTRETMRDFCRSYFDSESAVEVFDALAKADHMVYIERSQLAGKELSNRQFVEYVSRARHAAQALLNSQEDVRIRARAALLVAEVNSRTVNSGFPGHSRVDLDCWPFAQVSVPKDPVQSDLRTLRRVRDGSEGTQSDRP